MLKKNKRGDIAVTLLVILTVVIYTFTIIMFLVLGARESGEIKGYEIVQELNKEVDSIKFTGSEDLENLVKEKKGIDSYLTFWNKSLKIRVQYVGID